MDWKTQCYKDISSYKINYRFKAIPIKIPLEFLVETERLVLKLICKWTAKAILIKQEERGREEKGKEEESSKTYIIWLWTCYKITVLKQKRINTSMDRWMDRIQNQIHTYIVFWFSTTVLQQDRESKTEKAVKCGAQACSFNTTFVRSITSFPVVYLKDLPLCSLVFCAF